MYIVKRNFVDCYSCAYMSLSLTMCCTTWQGLMYSPSHTLSYLFIITHHHCHVSHAWYHSLSILVNLKSDWSCLCKAVLMTFLLQILIHCKTEQTSTWDYHIFWLCLLWHVAVCFDASKLHCTRIWAHSKM